LNVEKDADRFCVRQPEHAASLIGLAKVYLAAGETEQAQATLDLVKYLSRRIGALPQKLFGHGGGKLSADAGFAGDAAVDLQDGHDFVLGIDLLP